MASCAGTTRCAQGTASSGVPRTVRLLIRYIATSAGLAPTAKADHIYVLDQGVVAEEGTHGELMAVDGGLYRQMYEAQAAQYGIDQTAAGKIPAPRSGTDRHQGIGDHPDRQKDFQDYPMWRELVARVCTELDRFTHGGPAITPMTLLRRRYADDIFDALHRDGIEVCHLLVHADSDTIRTRIEASTEFPDSEERSEKVRAFRRRKLADYKQAYTTWLGERADVIDTTELSPEQVTAQALTLLRLP
ncbi:hypothetical protein [Streptomyces sp. NBC_01768]|uniref:hypothetical protein n=1 Tax=Streptomyces sp. NBC_01768 TaxID=2975938 RepID=UPI002DD9DF80|nr:hypothetical protein [Streptomyces sp. NBC_01768]WSC32152.1 hypothetical protein OG902_38755 [Streptomyces sp. NBC_01768]